jgi:hypothetical protein
VVVWANRLYCYCQFARFGLTNKMKASDARFFGGTWRAVLAASVYPGQLTAKLAANEYSAPPAGIGDWTFHFEAHNK